MTKQEKQEMNRERFMKFYYDMLLIRRFEERAGQLYGMGFIGGFCHLYIGQEAVAVGVQHALTSQDTVITSYRDHGHMLVCGMDPNQVMAELTGRRDGSSKGKGGSMHMFSIEKRFYGGHGIVGAQVPLGTGLGFAHKYKRDGGVCTCYLGDGAANQGQVYESFNMAALWNLPVVYVIENNKYGMGTAQERAAAGQLHQRGAAYGIPGVEVDGMNVISVHQAAKEWVEYTRSGKGPCILEMSTYRYRGHSMSDPAKYRTKEEVDKVRKESDPIDNIRQILLEKNYASEEALKQIDRDVRQVVAEAAKFAQESPEPNEQDIATDVLLETPTDKLLTS